MTHHTEDILYGFFSASAAEQFGHVPYFTRNGKIESITCLSRQADGSDCGKWDDLVFVGEITKYRGENPLSDNLLLRAIAAEPPE
jgi:hypothetical protein